MPLHSPSKTFRQVRQITLRYPDCYSWRSPLHTTHERSRDERVLCVKGTPRLSGRAMAQAVSRRPLTAEARVRSRVGPCGICSGQSGTETVFSPVNFIPPVLYYTGKRKKLIIFITGLHNKPKGCGASVASAAGPFTTKKTFAVFLLLVMLLAGLGACDMCISVATSYTDSGCVYKRNTSVWLKHFFDASL